MCDLPLWLDLDWVQAFSDIDLLQALSDIDLLQAFLAIFPVVIIISFAVAVRSCIGSLVRLATLFHKTTLLNEAGFHRPESPLWFALGP